MQSKLDRDEQERAVIEQRLADHHKAMAIFVAEQKLAAARSSGDAVGAVDAVTLLQYAGKATEASAAQSEIRSALPNRDRAAFDAFVESKQLGTPDPTVEEPVPPAFPAEGETPEAIRAEAPRGGPK